MSNRIIALALVTQEELELLGPQFDRAYPVDKSPCFEELLHAIDEAERHRVRDKPLDDPVS